MAHRTRVALLRVIAKYAGMDQFTREMERMSAGELSQTVKTLRSFTKGPDSTLYTRFYNAATSEALRRVTEAF